MAVPSRKPRSNVPAPPAPLDPDLLRFIQALAEGDARRDYAALRNRKP